MKTKLKKATLIVAMLAMLLTAVSPALAQEPTPAPTLPPAPTPCAAGQVSGTVVAVDPLTGTITVEYTDATGTHQCTATLTGSYDHPIVTLLGKYFGDISQETLAAALNDTKGCVLQDPVTLAYSWVDCATPGAVPVTVAGQNADGSFLVKLADGTPLNVSITDPAAAAKILAALKTLAVTVNNGDIVLVSDQIAMYHDQGLGFGVLVKLYFLAANAQAACLADAASPQCSVTVQSLVDEFKSGVGMGQLFKEYGRPAGMGVGHVRNGLPKDKGIGNGSGNPNFQPSSQVKDKNLKKGLCKPHGNGKGNGKGSCP